MSATFRVDVADVALTMFTVDVDLLGWDVVDREQEFEGFHRLTVYAEEAPAEAEGKLIKPIISGDADGWVTVTDWGVPLPSDPFRCICPDPPVAVAGCPAHPARYAAQQMLGVDSETCTCWGGNPAMFDGAHVECPVHGDVS